jgi:tight adherence protein B
MRRAVVRLIGLTLLASLAVPAASVAQESGVRIEDISLVDHPEVAVTVAVPLAPGEELAEDAFSVAEGGEERAVTIEPAEAGDLEVVLLIDTSGSMGGGAIAAAREAATTFVDALPEPVRVAVAEFSTEPQLLTGFDASRDEHRDVISSLRAEGDTALHDAVGLGLETLSPRTDGSGRAIVLLSDGEDTSSNAALEGVVAELADADVTFEAVAYGTDYTETQGLEALAEASGGSVTDAAEPDALVALYEQLAAGLTHRYTLRYASEGSGETNVVVRFAHGETTTDTRTIELPRPPTPTETPASEVPAPAVATETVEVSGLSRAALVIGGTLWFLGLALLTLVALWPGRVRAQLAGVGRRRPGGSGLTELASRASLVADEQLERRGYRRGLGASLERAGIDLRPGEFIVLATCGVVAAFALGAVLQGTIAGLLLAGLAALAARLVVSVKGDRRRARFADQLGDTLQLLSGSLRAGYGLMQAIDSVAREADAPASEEFARLVVETRLGRDANEALTAMAERMGSEDFSWVVQAIEIHREVGGDLAEVLDTVGDTIRERGKLRRQVKALSAEGRMSAWVLLVLPFAVAVLMYVVNRPYISELWSNGLLGFLMIGTGVVMMTAGMIWTMKLVKIEL